VDNRVDAGDGVVDRFLVRDVDPLDGRVVGQVLDRLNVTGDDRVVRVGEFVEQILSDEAGRSENGDFHVTRFSRDGISVVWSLSNEPVGPMDINNPRIKWSSMSSGTANASDVRVQEGAVLGVAYDDGTTPPSLGADSVVRSGTIVYDDVVAGDRLQTGHNALIRERTVLGDDVLVGTQTVIDGDTDVGSNVSMQTGVYVPTNTTIGDRVFLGPKATLLNDPYPVRRDATLVGPILNDDASIGAHATVLPEVEIGEGAFVGAGAIVTADVPPETLAVGTPARHRELPETLDGGNEL